MTSSPSTASRIFCDLARERESPPRCSQEEVGLRLEATVHRGSASIKFEAMSWLLTLQPVDQPRIQDALQTVGRAAYVASRFDQDVTSLVTWLKLTPELPDFWTWTPVQVEKFYRAIRRQMLHERLHHAARELQAEESEMAVLTRARKARNSLFHDMPYLPLHDLSRLRRLLPSQATRRDEDREASEGVLTDAVEQIRTYVYGLTPACALVGSWLFRFHEHDQYFPQKFFDAYAAQLGSWVLAPVWDLLPRLEGEPAFPAADGAIRPPLPRGV